MAVTLPEDATAVTAAASIAAPETPQKTAAVSIDLTTAMTVTLTEDATAVATAISTAAAKTRQLQQQDKQKQ